MIVNNSKNVFKKYVSDDDDHDDDRTTMMTRCLTYQVRSKNQFPLWHSVYNYHLLYNFSINT